MNNWNNISLFSTFISYPIIYFTKYNIISLIQSSFIILNTIIRLTYPSSYCPASQIKNGLLYSPIFHRTLATIAEFVFYYSQTKYFNIIFWYNIPFYLTLTGEILSWCYLLLQSELMGFLEDSTWTIFQFYILVYSNHSIKYYISLPYILYTLFYHLPYTYRTIHSPYIKYYTKSIVKYPDDYTNSWLIPSLLLIPVLFLIFIL